MIKSVRVRVSLALQVGDARDSILEVLNHLRKEEAECAQAHLFQAKTHMKTVQIRGTIWHNTLGEVGPNNVTLHGAS